MVNCYRHVFEEATSKCRTCRQSTCTDCTVPVRGIGTLCITCAIQKSGVRVRSHAF